MCCAFRGFAREHLLHVPFAKEIRKVLVAVSCLLLSKSPEHGHRCCIFPFILPSFLALESVSWPLSMVLAGCHCTVGRGPAFNASTPKNVAVVQCLILAGVFSSPDTVVSFRRLHPPRVPSPKSLSITRFGRGTCFGRGTLLADLLWWHSLCSRVATPISRTDCCVGCRRKGREPRLFARWFPAYCYGAETVRLSSEMCSLLLCLEYEVGT